MTRRAKRSIEPTRRALLASIVGVPLAGCVDLSDDGSNTDSSALPESQTVTGESTATRSRTGTDEPTRTDREPGTVEVAETTVVTDLEVPWDLTFAGDDAFFTEREVGLRRIDAEALRTAAALGPNDAELVLETADVPDFENPPFGGFLGVATHPTYPDPRAIYLYHSSVVDEPLNRVIRYDLDSDSLAIIVEGIPGTGGHLGGRIRFGPQDRLWITTGDAHRPELAQDPTTLAGAVLRVTEDGEVPPENPSYEVDADRRTLTYGHRNPQGLVFTPDGEAIVTEHGPAGRDEIAVVTPGANYGWPTARGGPDDPDYDAYGDHEAFTPPVVNTGPDTTWAPSGATYYRDGAIDGWADRLLVAGLISETLYAVRFVEAGGIDDTDVADDGVRYDAAWLDDRYDAVAHSFYEREFGRLRHVQAGPGGSVFLLTSNRDGRGADPFPTEDDDRIVRLDPA